MKKKRTSVLIVGGGPVGLSAAIELGWRGIPSVLVERRDGSIPLPKMNGVNARTMEFCRRWGISERVRNAGWPPDFPRRILYVTSLTGYQLGCLDYKSDMERAPSRTSPEHFQRCPQTWFDPILLACARSFAGNEIYHRVRLDKFEHRGDGVVAEAVDLTNGERMTIVADYMLACDGAKSQTRSALGIEMDGSPQLSFEVNVYFNSEEVFTLHDKGRAVMTWLIGNKGMWGALSAIDGRSLWRLWLSSMPRDLDLSTFDAASWVRAAMGKDFNFTIVGVLPWVRQQLVARTFQKGRIFLCGDAVHNLTPTGGFGMNTGIQDAVDISWKIEGVLKGWADPHILDSYEIERHPVGIRNVNEATRTFNAFLNLPPCNAIEEAGDEGETQRNTLRRHIVDEQFNREFENEGIVLGYRYDPSPICMPDGSPPPPDEVMKYFPTARPGSRAPHAWLSDGRSTLDLFGRGFVLLQFGAEPPPASRLLEAAKNRGVPISVVSITEPHVAALYETRMALVRPDGHVAWRADDLPQDCMALVETIRGAA